MATDVSELRIHFKFREIAVANSTCPCASKTRQRDRFMSSQLALHDLFTTQLDHPRTFLPLGVNSFSIYFTVWKGIRRTVQTSYASSARREWVDSAK